MRTACALALLACLAWPAWQAQGAPAVAEGQVTGTPTTQAQFAPAPADALAAELLSTARYALAQLELTLSAQDRRIYSGQAVTALTALYQLHGCTWAREPLVELYRRPGCTDLHVGYSADGRLMLRVEQLALKNPAFASYAVYLCTLVSHTPLDLRSGESGLLRIKLAGGTVLEAQPITSAHPLWPHLERLARTFSPVAEVPTGSGRAFKQVFALNPGLPSAGAPSGSVSAVSLVWDGYCIEVPYYKNEVQRERASTK